MGTSGEEYLQQEEQKVQGPGTGHVGLSVAGARGGGTGVGGAQKSGQLPEGRERGAVRVGIVF